MNMSKLEAFTNRVLGDAAAACTLVMTNIGHKLGLYRALAAGPLTASDLAERTGAHERYVREWLGNQVAAGYVDHDPTAATYTLAPEHAAVLVQPDSPVFLAPVGDVASALWRGEDRLRAAFLSGDGIGWHEQHQCLFHATEAFFRTGYQQHLVQEWLPALDGVVQRLQAGARVADVGCGHGASTILMARAFPASTFVGFDAHEASLEVARSRAREAGVADRVSFQKARANDFPGADYALICYMDAFHDLGDPTLSARHARKALATDGRLMLVEPFASDGLHQDRGPVAAMYYAASTGFCTPNALSQGRVALGAQAGPARLTATLQEGGFGQVRVATATPFNVVLEAKP
jgi:SAM-dependent methyltransferase